MAGQQADGEGERSRREAVFRRDGFRCVYCAEVFEPKLLTLDHVEPRMRGGDHSEGNLVTACQSCNAAKASLPAWGWLSDRPVERENFLRHAQHVWPRLRRAVEEEAARASRGRGKGRR